MFTVIYAKAKDESSIFSIELEPVDENHAQYVIVKKSDYTHLLDQVAKYKPASYSSVLDGFEKDICNCERFVKIVRSLEAKIFELQNQLSSI